MLEKMALKGFEVVNLECGKGDAVMTITPADITFNRATAAELGHPAYVRILVNKMARRIAIEPCLGDDKNAIPFDGSQVGDEGIMLKTPAVLMETQKLIGIEDEQRTKSYEGMLYYEDQVIIFDLSRVTENANDHACVVENESGETVGAKDENEVGASENVTEEVLEDEPSAIPRRRGRPKKVALPAPAERLIITTNPGETVVVMPKNRGWKAETEQTL